VYVDAERRRGAASSRPVRSGSRLRPASGYCRRRRFRRCPIPRL